MKFRFAVIDDAAFLRELIKNTVTELGGHCVAEASSGEEGIIAVRASLPSVVFLDMVMPRKNGIETAKLLKASNPEIKIIGCSSIEDSLLIEAAYEAGFDVYVKKPFSKDDIFNALKRCIPSFQEVDRG